MSDGAGLFLPEHRLAVLGSSRLEPAAAEMAGLLGQEIVAAGHGLVTDGCSATAGACVEGALRTCRARGVDPRAAILSVHRRRDALRVTAGEALAVGSRTGRRCELVRRTWGAFVIAGDRATRQDLLVATVQAIVEGYSVLPVPGTGGLADRICQAVPPSGDPILLDPRPSADKARALVARLTSPPCWICDLDPVELHDRWFVHPQDARSRAMLSIRRRYF